MDMRSFLKVIAVLVKTMKLFYELSLNSKILNTPDQPLTLGNIPITACRAQIPI